MAADSDLLGAFATRRDEAAFTALAERYAGMVYGVALRRLGDPGAAQDAASEVFTLLARKAAALSQTGSLAAWLQRSAVLVAANAARREIRRRNAMNAYISSQDPAPPPPPPFSAEESAWRGAAAEHLDEALARLSERDRALLLERFFAGRTHREIARAGGVAEESVKKAGQRALAKLRALLLRRGVTFSAAVLASALTGHLQAAAPAGLAARVSTTALQTAPALGALPALQHSISYMFYGKTLTSAAAAALLCAALGGGSFLTARQLAAHFSHASEVAAAASAAPAKPAAGNRDKSPTAARGVGEIMREAVRLLRRSRGEGSPEMDRAILLFAGLGEEEIRAAADEAGTYREETKLAEALASALGAAWAEKDPAAALAWLEVFPRPGGWPARGGADKIVIAWFERDGRAAWEWWIRRGRATPPPAAGWAQYIGEGAGRWALTDPAAAAEAVGKIEASSVLLGTFAAQLRLDVNSPVVEAVLGWKSASQRAEFARLLFKKTDYFARDHKQLPRLFPVLNRLCADDPGALESAVAPMIEEWAESEPVKAVSWILDEASSSPANTRDLLQPALGIWSENVSSEKASQWVQGRLWEHPAQAPRIYEALLSHDPVAIVEGSPWPTRDWCRSIEEWPPGLRDGFARHWAEQRLHRSGDDFLSPEESLARWRNEIAKAESKGQTAAAALGRHALRFAEESVSTPISSPAVSPSLAP